MSEKYCPVYDDDGKIIEVTGSICKKKMVCVEELIEELNDLNQTKEMWMKSAKKYKKLLYEKIEPTYSDNVYLAIDNETKRCKYEHTHICLDFKCDYYSTYFLNCRFMMEDDQLRKAKELGIE